MGPESITYLLDVLESVDDEAFDGDTSEHLIVIDHDGLYCILTLYLGQQYERVQIVVRKHKFLKLCEFL